MIKQRWEDCTIGFYCPNCNAELVADSQDGPNECDCGLTYSLVAYVKVLSSNNMTIEKKSINSGYLDELLSPHSWDISPNWLDGVPTGDAEVNYVGDPVFDAARDELKELRDALSKALNRIDELEASQ